jgi:hypothetical protein
VNQPDFEIDATLRALELTVFVAPEAQVEGEEAILERQRAAARELLKDRRAYENVAVEKKVAGRLSKDR